MAPAPRRLKRDVQRPIMLKMRCFDES